MVNLPFQLPIQLGQGDPFERSLQAAPVFRYTTMISGDLDQSQVGPATDLLLATSAGGIFQFWNAQQQLANLSGLPQVSVAGQLPAVSMRYSRNQTLSQLDVMLYPEAVANLQEALEFTEQKRGQANLPMSITSGLTIRIEIEFEDWNITDPNVATDGSYTFNWAAGYAVSPYQLYVGSEALIGQKYFELQVLKLPRDHPPDFSLGFGNGGMLPDDFDESPVHRITQTDWVYRWPSELNTYYTPNVGIVRKDVLTAQRAGAIKNPYDNIWIGLNENTVGGVALSTLIGRQQRHITQPVTYGGYKLIKDSGDTRFKWADYFIAGPDSTDTSNKTWVENEIVGRDGYLFQVAWGSGGSAPRTGPPTSFATPGIVTQFTWSGVVWFYIGSTSEGLLNLTTRGWIKTDRPRGSTDTSPYYATSQLVPGANYVIASSSIPNDGFLWVPAPAIAPDGFALNFIDTTHSGSDGYHLSDTGICASHIDYVATYTVTEATDTYSKYHKYGDTFEDVPGSTPADDGTTASEIPPNHGPGRTFPILNGGVWPAEGGVNLGDIVENDVIRVAVDRDRGKIWFGLNDTWQGRPGIDGEAVTFDTHPLDEWYPAAGGFGGLTALLCLGAKLKFSPPSGFKAAGENIISFDIPYDIG